VSYTDYESQAAAEYGVPQTLALDLFGAESNNTPNAVNSVTGAEGMGQILPSTAANPGYGLAPLTDPFNAQSNINFSLQYLAALFKQFGSWVAAVLHYYPNAATDPNYASTYAAAQAADAANAGTGASMSLMGGSIDPGLAEALSGSNFETGTMSNPQNTTSFVQTAQNPLSLLSGVGNYIARGGLIILGIGLILVAVMALARRSDVATETARLKNAVTR
jgi:hypothetical protein